MQKRFSKLFFITILVSIFLLSGCSKKNEDIILSMEADASAVSGMEEVKAPAESVSKESAEETSKEIEKEAVKETTIDASIETSSETVQQPAMPETMMVYVCGAVLCEGVYELPSGSRVVDAVKAAGGFTADAETSYVNQAQVLADGVKLKIPTKDEVLDSSEGLDTANADMSVSIDDSIGITSGDKDSGITSETAGKAGKVNINTASKDELCLVPGIGPSKAGSIISYREENGKFSSIEDIMNVSGIKEKFFSKIKDYITI